MAISSYLPTGLLHSKELLKVEGGAHGRIFSNILDFTSREEVLPSSIFVGDGGHGRELLCVLLGRQAVSVLQPQTLTSSSSLFSFLSVGQMSVGGKGMSQFSRVRVGVGALYIPPMWKLSQAEIKGT